MKRLISLAVLFCGTCMPPNGHAAALQATSAADAGELHQAMSSVGAGNSRVISLEGGHYAIGRDNVGAKCDLPGFSTVPELPAVRGRVTIEGNGSVLTGVDGARLPFCIHPGGELVLENLEIREFGIDTENARFPVAVALNEGSLDMENVTVRANGIDTIPGAPRAIVLNRVGGTMTIRGSWFADNVSAYRHDYAHIVLSEGDVLVHDSAFTGNRMPGIGVNDRPGKATVFESDFNAAVDMLNVTFSGNSHGLTLGSHNVIVEHATVVDNGYGIHFRSSEADVVRNSIIALNVGPDCQFHFESEGIEFQGVNLDSDGTCRLDPQTDLVRTNPRLKPLRPLSSGIPGHVPRPGSPVLDRGDPRFCPFRDGDGRIRDTAADDDGRCALGSVERWNARPFEIDARLTGTWFDPGHDGHYLSFQVLPINLVAAAWWTYDSEGNPYWLVGSGSVDGDAATLEVYASRGMALPALDADRREQSRWGTLELEFRNCHSMDMHWESNRPGFENGEASLTRLTVIDGLQC